MSKHYIKIDNNKRITKGFSTDFEEPQENDICINENGGRHFELLGQINPSLLNMQGVYLYKYENGEITKRTEEEIGNDINEIPKELSQTDLVMLALADLDTQRQQDKLDTQLAIAELTSTLMGGE